MRMLSLILAFMIILMPFAAAAENNVVVGSINKSKGGDERLTKFAEGSDRGKQAVDSDVIIEVVGYQPTIIDSTLLEHQNVYVTALLAGIPVSPTVTVPKIRDIKIKKTDVNTTPAGKPVNVVGVQYFKPKDQELSFDNLGYIVVTLGAIPKEQDVPEKVKIGLQAEVHVDLYDRIGASTFEDVLRAEPFDTWKENRHKHRNFAGYVHAKEVQDTYAVFDIYTEDLVPIAQNVKVAKGQTSGALQEDNRLFKTPSETIFDKYRLQVNDIRKQSDTVHFMIDRQGVIETRALQLGQQLYPGSSWKLAKIERGTSSQSAQLGDCKIEPKLSTREDKIVWSAGNHLSAGGSNAVYVHT